MENWLVNAYCIGFVAACIIFLLTFSGIVREQYIWRKTFWTVPYTDKRDRAAVYGVALFASFVWPIVLASAIIIVVTVFLYGCLYFVFKNLR